jgi:RNA polymerase sigma-70 factor (ECF subfamily)
MTENPHDKVNRLIEHLFRHESGKMVSVLTRLLGFQNLEVAQDIVQESLLKAMTVWRFGTPPDNPAGWLYRVARNKAIDYLRRENTFRQLSSEYGNLLQSEYTLSPTVTQMFFEKEIRDSQLRMVFACCHPEIPIESQVALTLKTLCGLTVSEIARAFITSEETIAKRIYRAKEKIKAKGIELQFPSTSELPIRLNSVLQCLYLLFNEGYNSSHPDQLIREDLCEEAMRLCLLLAEQKVSSSSQPLALMALMCFQASRLRSRLDAFGHIIILKNQDRKNWDQRLIRKGYDYIEEAGESGEISHYHIEAAIASLHASAISFEQTDWKSIYHLYVVLFQLKPSPIVALNKAIASAYAVSKTNAIQELQNIKGLENHYLYYATLGEMHFEMNQFSAAQAYYERAIKLTPSRTEQDLLREKISRCKN